MRTFVTDRFAVKVWLPGILGGLGLAVWFFDPSGSNSELIFALVWVVIAGAALWERQRKPRHLR